MRLKANTPRSGVTVSRVLQGLTFMAIAQCASAAPTSLPSEEGVLKLSNVKIQTATPQQIAAINAPAKPAAKPGFRAYKDPVTGNLIEQPDENVNEPQATSALSKSGFAPGAKAVSTSKSGKAILLDDSFMSNAIVTKNASGKLDLDCVTGDHAKSLPNSKTAKAHKHDN
jgi:hypothetical protein